MSRTCKVTYNHGKLYGETKPHIYWNPIYVILKNYILGIVCGTYNITTFLVRQKPPTYLHYMREHTQNNGTL